MKLHSLSQPFVRFEDWLWMSEWTVIEWLLWFQLIATFTVLIYRGTGNRFEPLGLRIVESHRPKFHMFCESFPCSSSSRRTNREALDFASSLVDVFNPVSGCFAGRCGNPSAVFLWGSFCHPESFNWTSDWSNTRSLSGLLTNTIAVFTILIHKIPWPLIASAKSIDTEKCIDWNGSGFLRTSEFYITLTVLDDAASGMLPWCAKTPQGTTAKWTQRQSCTWERMGLFSKCERTKTYLHFLTLGWIMSWKILGRACRGEFESTWLIAGAAHGGAQDIAAASSAALMCLNAFSVATESFVNTIFQGNKFLCECYEIQYTLPPCVYILGGESFHSCRSFQAVQIVPVPCCMPGVSTTFLMWLNYSFPKQITHHKPVRFPHLSVLCLHSKEEGQYLSLVISWFFCFTLNGTWPKLRRRVCSPGALFLSFSRSIWFSVNFVCFSRRSCLKNCFIAKRYWKYKCVPSG